MKCVEELPFGHYHASESGVTWYHSLQDLVRSQSTADPPQQCLYSFFISEKHVGRNNRDISVYIRDPYSSDIRRNEILLWWIYTSLAVVMVITKNKRAQASNMARKKIFCWQPLWGRRRDTRLSPEVDALTLVRMITQFICVMVFIVSFLQTECENLRLRVVGISEPFSAVGQSGSVTAVGLVLTAAVVTRIYQNSEQANDEGPDSDTEEHNLEVDWDHTCGYAL